MHKGELKHIKKISRKVLPRKTRKKIAKVEGGEEQLELYKHSIKSFFELKHYQLEKIANSLSKNHEVFHLITKVNLLKMKIKYFLIDYGKEDLKEILNEIKSIESELRHIERGKK